MDQDQANVVPFSRRENIPPPVVVHFVFGGVPHHPNGREYATPKQIEVLEDFWVPSIRDCMGAGLTESVAGRLASYSKYAYASGVKHLVDFFDTAHQWLKEAQAYEAIHGKGSMECHEHPLHQQIMAIRNARRLRTGA